VIALGATASADAAASGDIAALAGRWQGTIWEIGAHLIQGRVPVEVRLREDGTWSGKVGPADASGVARLDQKGWLIISGTVHETDRVAESEIYWELVGDSTRRSGQIEATFFGRDEHAAISLQKAP
jgi:hypothetical protein